MKKATFILLTSAFYLISCSEATDSHEGHVHGPNGEHLDGDEDDHEEHDHDGDDHDHDHGQEDFVVESDSLHENSTNELVHDQNVDTIQGPIKEDNETGHDHDHGSGDHNHDDHQR